jgi:hypothetical protein
MRGTTKALPHIAQRHIARRGQRETLTPFCGSGAVAQEIRIHCGDELPLGFPGEETQAESNI